MQLWQYCLLVTASDLAVTNKQYCQKLRLVGSLYNIRLMMHGNSNIKKM